MNVIEITHPKDYRHAWKKHGVRDVNKAKVADPAQIKQMIEILKNQNRSPASILSNIRQMFGASAMPLARKELGSAYMEAMNTAPVQDEQVDIIRGVLEHPLHANDALSALDGVLSDDGLNAELQSDPELTDVRPIIMKWLELNMPHLLNSPDVSKELGNGEGIFSPLHGYDEDDYGVGGATLDFAPH